MNRTNFTQISKKVIPLILLIFTLGSIFVISSNLKLQLSDGALEKTKANTNSIAEIETKRERQLQNFFPQSTFERPNLIPLNVTNPIDLNQTDTNDHSVERNGYRTVSVFGNYTMGYYFVPIFIGPTHHRVDLIMDSGSSLTTFPCSNCYHCGKHYNKPYNIDASSSYEKLNCSNEYLGWKCGNCRNNKSCPFNLHYVEGSGYDGEYSMDYVLFQDEIANFDAITDDSKKSKFKSIFGCTTNETNMLYEQDSDGILGLGRGTNGYNYPPNIIDASLQEHRLNKKGFSICYGHNGGLLTIGDWNHNKHLKNSKETVLNFRPGSEQYSVSLSKIQVGGEDINLSTNVLNPGSQGAFFDSGTT